jgi:hypothetical protein
MRTQLLVIMVLAAGCSSKETGEKTKESKPETAAKPSKEPEPAVPAVQKLPDAEHACDALTPAEVEEVLKLKTTAKMLPQAGEYGAPECGWLVSDAKDAAGVTVTLFFQDTEAESKEYFAKKLDSVCMNYETKKDARLVVLDLGDEAAFCGGLWVRQGTSYFSVTTPGASTADIEAYKAAQIALARRVLPRLP